MDLPDHWEKIVTEEAVYYNYSEIEGVQIKVHPCYYYIKTMEIMLKGEDN